MPVHERLRTFTNSHERSRVVSTFCLISTILAVTINPLDPVPVYGQLAAILRARIERNEFPPRQPLPSESQLMGEYGVSRGSVRHALQVLAEEGLTVTIQGRGTYVLPLERGLSNKTLVLFDGADMDRAGG